jgi:hypothetical protein
LRASAVEARRQEVLLVAAVEAVRVEVGGLAGVRVDRDRMLSRRDGDVDTALGDALAGAAAVKPRGSATIVRFLLSAVMPGYDAGRQRLAGETPARPSWVTHTLTLNIPRIS